VLVYLCIPTAFIFLNKLSTNYLASHQYVIFRCFQTFSIVTVCSGADSIGHGGTSHTITNDWARGSPWVEEQHTRNWPLTITKALTKATNCTCRAKKWRGTTKKISGTFKFVPAPQTVCGHTKMAAESISAVLLWLFRVHFDTVDAVSSEGIYVVVKSI